MAENEECERLIPKENAQSCLSKKVKFFVSIGIVLIFSKGSEAILSSCFKQYVYFWSKQYLNKTDGVPVRNNDHGNSTSGNDGCSSDKDSKSAEDKAQTLASQWQMYFEIINAVLAFISTSAYGTLSDYIGRKKFGCLSLFGYCLKCTIVAAVIYFDMYIGYCIVAYVVDGLCGSVYTFSLYSYSSSADVTSDVRERVLGIALIQLFIGVGVLTTDIVDGYFIHKYGYFYPMLTAAIGLFLSLALVIILLEETTDSLSSKSNQIQTKTERIPSCGTLFKNYIGFYVNGEQSGKTIFWLCLAVFSLLQIVILGRGSVTTLYQLGQPFCWSSETIGWYGGIYVGITHVIGMIAMKPVLHILPEDIAACIGLASGIAFSIVTALATTTYTLFIAIGAGFLMYLPKSIIRGMASSRAMSNKQGAIFAGIQSSELICSLISGPLSLSIYSHTLDTMNGLVFLVFAGFCLLALILMILLCVLLRKEDYKKKTTIVVESPKVNDTTENG